MRAWLLSSLWIGLSVGCGESRTPAAIPQRAKPVQAEGAKPGELSSESSRVQLQQTDKGWQLVRNGMPYFVRGAGGEGSKRLLADLGGNSVRTWGVEQLEQTLQEAHRQGLTVTAGIWFAHERHGFNYKDPAQVARQKEVIREVVLKYRSHPALLLWSLGNEMEGYGDGGDKAIWDAVNDAAVMVKELDPDHPVMTVVSEIGGHRVDCLHKWCPAIDIVGVNSYGGAATLGERYQEAGGKKPFIVTEFGPRGPWEAQKTTWGAVIEPSSTEKAATYRRAYEKGVVGNPGQCLGSYAFSFGHKRESTATWFGMLLPEGDRLAPADVLSALWTGKPLSNTCPILESLEIEGSDERNPGDTLRANLVVRDRDQDELRVRWVVEADPLIQGVGGDAEVDPPSFPDSIVNATKGHAEIRLPDKPGAYRLYAYASDGHGGSAVANVPLLVKGATGEQVGAPAALPLIVYDEGSREHAPYSPSGWMGNTKALKYDGACSMNPHSGKTCIRVDYNASDEWGGIAWQSPENDWGDKPGGWNLMGAKKLSIWLRGEKGDETCSIELGILGGDKKFPDTASAKLEDIKLSKEWRKYSIELDGKDLKRIKTGLVITIPGQGQSVTVFCDDCRYE